MPLSSRLIHRCSKPLHCYMNWWITMLDTTQYEEEIREGRNSVSGWTSARHARRFPDMCSPAYEGSIVNKVGKIYAHAVFQLNWMYSIWCKWYRVSQFIKPLHLSVQELLTALHNIISKLPPSSNFQWDVWQSSICSCVPLLRRIYTEGIKGVVAQWWKGTLAKPHVMHCFYEAHLSTALSPHSWRLD